MGQQWDRVRRHLPIDICLPDVCHPIFAYFDFCLYDFCPSDFSQLRLMPIATYAYHQKKYPNQTNAHWHKCLSDFCRSDFCRSWLLPIRTFADWLSKWFLLEYITKKGLCWWKINVISRVLVKKKLPQLQNDPIISLLSIYCIFLVISKCLDRQKSDRQKSQSAKVW